MNHIIQAIMSTIFHYKRTCPKCKKDQVIPPSSKHKTVPCKFCRTDIPPFETKHK